MAQADDDRARRAQIAADVTQRLRAIETQHELTMEDLAGFSVEELIDYLELNGASIDQNQIKAAIRQTIGEEDFQALERGDHFDPSRQELLEKKVGGATRNAAAQVAKETMRSQRQQLLDEADDRPPSERFYVWVAKLIKSCRSCEARHGRILAYDQWLDVGRPGDGTTLCRKNCECDLVFVPNATAEDTRQKIDDLEPG